MPNRNLLVPGTGGITLMDSQGNDLGYPVKMRLGVATRGYIGGLSAPELVELLSMEHEPGQIAPVRTSLKPGISIRPGHVLRVAYNQVPSDFVDFLYDWRADLRYSAARLLDFLRERKPRDGRWNLVGHSQGGLLIILASKLLDRPDAFAELVASVTLVGAPIAGTLNAAKALIDGDNMGDEGSASFRKIMRTWPSLYQMLPAWPAVLDDEDRPAPADRQLTHPGGWGGAEDISDDLLARAREAQRLLRDPLGHMEGDIGVAVLFGRNRRTARALRAAAPLTSTPAETQLGDTLVPHDQTLAWIGGHFAQFVITFPSPCNAHAMLCNDPGIATRIRSLLIA
ncbi:MAG TPA: hypothetical protein VF212_17715 [Longimicrobiales bacterium]